MKLHKIFAAVVAGLVLTSCGDQFLTSHATHQGEAGAEATEGAILSYLTAAYQPLLMDSYADYNYNHILLLSDLRSDDIYKGGGDAGDQSWMYHLSLFQIPASESPAGIWSLYYTAIARANNTVLAIDNAIFGNVNSSLVCGSAMMNGIGGSADFARNCALGFFLTPSVAKNGAISSVVPYVSHVDHTEHDTMIFVTEQGLADLRGLPAEERARLIIKNCAHPDFRDELTDILEFGLKHAKGVHLPLALSRAFEMHNRFLETGKML